MDDNSVYAVMCSKKGLGSQVDYMMESEFNMHAIAHAWKSGEHNEHLLSVFRFACVQNKASAAELCYESNARVCNYVFQPKYPSIVYPVTRTTIEMMLASGKFTASDIGAMLPTSALFRTVLWFEETYPEVAIGRTRTVDHLVELLKHVSRFSDIVGLQYYYRHWLQMAGREAPDGGVVSIVPDAMRNACTCDNSDTALWILSTLSRSAVTQGMNDMLACAIELGSLDVVISVMPLLLDQYESSKKGQVCVKLAEKSVEHDRVRILKWITNQYPLNVDESNLAQLTHFAFGGQHCSTKTGRWLLEKTGTNERDAFRYIIMLCKSIQRGVRGSSSRKHVRFLQWASEYVTDFRSLWTDIVHDPIPLNGDTLEYYKVAESIGMERTEAVVAVFVEFMDTSSYSRAGDQAVLAHYIARDNFMDAIPDHVLLRTVLRDAAPSLLIRMQDYLVKRQISVDHYQDFYYSCVVTPSMGEDELPYLAELYRRVSLGAGGVVDVDYTRMLIEFGPAWAVQWALETFGQQCVDKKQLLRSSAEWSLACGRPAIAMLVDEWADRA